MRLSVHAVTRLTLGAHLRHQAVVSFTWDSAGRTLSYPYEEYMAESDDLSTHLADLIRRLLQIKLVWWPTAHHSKRTMTFEATARYWDALGW